MSYPISSAISTFIAAFANTGAVVTGGHGIATGGVLNGSSPFTTALTSLLNNTQNQPNQTTQPKAAINWILFDDQFKPVSEGSDLVSSTGDIIKGHAITSIPMAKNGYLYVYCSNENNIDVFFDNLQVVNTRGPLLDETHYYPFGLAMAGISDKAWNKIPNAYHFNGNEIQNSEFADGTSLDNYDFNARNYDQQIGRFMQIDPEMLSYQQASLTPYQFALNNPSTYNDPSGKCPWCLAGALIGGVINLGTHILSGKVTDFKSGLVAFGIGAVAGFVGAATGGATLLASTSIGASGIATAFTTGVISAAYSSEIQGVGSQIAFGDPYGPKDLINDMAAGGVLGVATFGVSKLFQRRWSIEIPKVEDIPTTGENETWNSSLQPEYDPNAIEQGYTYTKSAGAHLNEYSDYAGVGNDVESRYTMLKMPYLTSTMTINSIMATGPGIADLSYPGGFNWKVPASFRGSPGFFELGLNPETKVIYHFNFVGK